MSRRTGYVLSVIAGGIIVFLFGYMFNDVTPATEWKHSSIRKLEVPNINYHLKTDKSSDWRPPVSDVDNGAAHGKTRVYRFDGNRVVRLAEFCTWTVHLDCVSLKTPSGPTPIHIHDVKVDRYVSQTIKKTGYWEKGNVNLVLNELKKDPELGFMDLGSHVGAFSLSVAKFGRKVVSVDPLIENVQRLCKSIQKGGFTEQMTIIFNPLSNVHASVNFKREVDNVGGTQVIAASKLNRTRDSCEEPTDSHTVMLDDLLPLIPFRKAVLKMDVQEHEYKVLKGASKFFQNVHVTAILMEWVMMKVDPSAEPLINLLLGYNFKAFVPSINGAELDPKNFKNWPFDVIWRRQ